MTSLGVNSTSILNGKRHLGAFDVEIEHPVSIRNRFGIALLFLNRLPQSISYCRNDLRPQPGPLSYWMIWQLTVVRECRRRNAMAFYIRSITTTEAAVGIFKGEEHVSESHCLLDGKRRNISGTALRCIFWTWEHLPFLHSSHSSCDSTAHCRPIHSPMGVALCIWAAAKSAAFTVGAVSRGSWRHTSANDAMRIVLANSAGSILGGLVILLLVGPWAFRALCTSSIG